jgi:hypothetical protein
LPIFAQKVAFLTIFNQGSVNRTSNPLPNLRFCGIVKGWSRGPQRKPLTTAILYHEAQMFVINRTLNVFDVLFSAAETISEFDYVEFGEKLITFFATIAAIIVGFTSYVYTAVQLWWEDNNETTLTRGFQFVIHTMDFAHEVYIAGKDFRSIVNSFTAYTSAKVR